ncbi:complex I subunit 4 family protein [Granulicella tundricola]|uniref:Proton-translocating NADH-quinone oxidoreductase, chain M n=1 Tax=Granulicella tundricola (strain ATCC BAA-1859 / DSM 23138 / MP5ACTX9) TaxID=1198114 RepID=E8X4N6_GRATM|nr:NADH-quinone oxidoreductase subunit M [Granulicella tundricola]ADW69446.1 proton-translocating NADH-quinone oxidoreductase, chain M [Granulicella tundricola MP5ACTX9]
MNIDTSILTLIIAVPLAGAAVLALLPDRGNIQKFGALIVTLFTLLCTLHLPAHFNGAAPAGSFQFVIDHDWITAPSIRYHLGVDAMSMWLVVLTAFLAPLGVLASWKIPSINERAKTFYVLFLLQQVAMLGLFLALDLFLYYAFFELSLVPMTILIATFGRTKNRRPAAIKYFVYNFIPSAILLVGILWLYVKTGTFQFPALAGLAAAHNISPNGSALGLASLAFLIAFCVKVPVFPLHGWLKDAIVEAPTAAVMVLAGKTGLYSILRFSFGIFPEQSHHIAPLMLALGAIGIVYGALIATTRNDLKELAAYSTLSHLSFITLGIFGFTIAGLDGGIYQILNHGISGSALFLLLGFLYERYGTYDMRDLGGLAQKLPWMVTLYVITTLSVIGLPGLNSFVGEFLVLSGSMQAAFAHHVFWTVLATTGVILSAAYMLIMIQRVFYGHLGVTSSGQPSIDLNAREHTALWPLVAVMVLMGVSSPYWLHTIDTNGVAMSLQRTAAPAEAPATRIESESYPKPVFVDPALGAAALHQQPEPALKGARY